MKIEELIENVYLLEHDIYLNNNDAEMRKNALIKEICMVYEKITSMLIDDDLDIINFKCRINDNASEIVEAMQWNDNVKLMDVLLYDTVYILQVLIQILSDECK